MNVRIEMTYRTPKGTETFFNSEEMTAEKALLMAEDLHKTGRAKEVAFIDYKDNSWSMKELQGLLKEIETEPHDITVYFDGNYDLKTRKSGLGCVIYYQQNNRSFRLRKNTPVDGINSNNEAEYAAFHLGIQELNLLGVHHLPVMFIGDSQVVINQLNGEWPCYEEALSSWIDRIEAQLEKLGIDADYQLVPRKKNQEADQLATQALKGIDITSTIKQPQE